MSLDSLPRPRVVAIVPARRASTRLPDKMLADLDGEPLIVRTWRRVLSASLDAVLVATDDDEIAAVVKGAGGVVVRTGPADNGTHRVAEAARDLAADVVVNVQGDEPLVSTDTIDRIVRGLCDADGVGFSVSTGAAPLAAAEAHNPARVKVVTDRDGRAVAFSRRAIPVAGPWSVHVGVYAFRAQLLRELVVLPATANEVAERLEQLRWLDHGVAIRVVAVETPGLSIDTAEDLACVRAIFARARGASPGVG